jgi:hypothetical protein
MILLDELDRKAWAGCIVDDLPECHALLDGNVQEGRTWFKWPPATIKTFERLLGLCRDKGGVL